jgi:hypothetical protein
VMAPEDLLFWYRGAIHSIDRSTFTTLIGVGSLNDFDPQCLHERLVPDPKFNSALSAESD